MGHSTFNIHPSPLINPKVAVVILNYNGRHWLEKFLPGVIANSTIPNTEIIVADNASTDDSVSFLKQHFPQVRQVLNTANTGYAGGYDEALKQIDAEYYVLLNSDVEVTPGWIDAIISNMEADPMIAAAQPKILAYDNKEQFEYAGAAGGYIDRFGYPFCRGRIFDTCEPDQGQYDSDSEIFWASGACLFIKARLYHESGGLDADFFAHMEEIDLCWRLKNMGYKVMYYSNSVIYHVGGGTLNKTNPRKTFLNFRNNRAMIYKNARLRDILYIELVRDILDLAVVLAAIAKGNLPEAKAVLRGIWHYLKSIQHILHGKRRKLRTQRKTQAATPNMSGVYRGSIVYTYFVRKIRTFSGLPASKLQPPS